MLVPRCSSDTAKQSVQRNWQQLILSSDICSLHLVYLLYISFKLHQFHVWAGIRYFRASSYHINWSLQTSTCKIVRMFPWKLNFPISKNWGSNLNIWSKTNNLFFLVWDNTVYSSKLFKLNIFFAMWDSHYMYLFEKLTNQNLVRMCTV